MTFALRAIGWGIVALLLQPGTGRAGGQEKNLGEMGAAPSSATAERVVPRLSDLDDDDIARRLDFIEKRLDTGRGRAQLWSRGWLGVFSSGIAIQGVRAGLSHDSGARADSIVGAVKAVGGVANLVLRPLAAADGAEALRGLSGEDREARLRKLALAEDLLRRNAERAEGRTSWKRHLIGAAVNLAGGLILWQGFGEPGRALISTGLGIAAGEALLWTQPAGAIGDLRDYEQRFERRDGLSQRIEWRPRPGGLALVFSF